MVTLNDFKIWLGRYKQNPDKIFRRGNKFITLEGLLLVNLIIWNGNFYLKDNKVFKNKSKALRYISSL